MRGIACNWLNSAERAHYGGFWRLFQDKKTFCKHLEAVNDFCRNIIRERLQQPVQSISTRNDLLSRIIVEHESEHHVSQSLIVTRT